MSREAIGSRRISRPARARPRVQRTIKARIKTWLALSILAGELVLATVLAAGLVVFWRFSHNLPDLNSLNTQAVASSVTTIWSQDGVLLGKLEEVNRTPVPLGDIAPDMLHATVAIEDHRFYHHFGVDPIGIMRAAYVDFRGGNPTREGASTLTQQLVRNLGISGVNMKKNYARKLKEALIAIRIEQLYSKDEILALYLNNVYYGGGAYGVEAAARTYFGKSSADLDLSQAALLSGLPQLPSVYSPFAHPLRALQRRDEVLDAMQKYGYITSQQSQDAKSEHLHFQRPAAHRGYNFKAPYFVWYVLADLIHRYGIDFVESGLKIETTLNWGMQQNAEKALEHGLENASYTGANQGCLISIDNSDGSIRAMVGGRSFVASQFNIVTQGRRQPGSTFKLFDYSAAFDTGKAGIDTTFHDVPIVYPNTNKVVHDFEGYSYQWVTCKQAIARSINTIAVQVAETVGIRTVIAYAHAMGITAPLAPYYPTAIGASAVSPFDLCKAYSVVANNGILRKPLGIRMVTDATGSIVEEHLPDSTFDVLKSNTVSQLNEAFQAVVDEGTGTAAKGDSSNGIVQNAHGKTGTTSDFRDAWFAGYTPELTTVVWCGDVRHGRYLPMNNGQGGIVCAPIWHDFMIKSIPVEQKYLASKQTRDQAQAPVSQTPPKKAPVTIANPSGKPASSAPAPTVTPPALNPGSGNSNNPVLPGTQPTLAPENQNTSSANAAPTSSVTPEAPSPVRPSRLAIPKDDPMVTVTICVDSRKKATVWCPETINVRMPESKARKLGYCTIHKPPPGAG